MGWSAVYDMALPDHTNLHLFRMKKKVGSVGFLKKKYHIFYLVQAIKIDHWNPGIEK